VNTWWVRDRDEYERLGARLRPHLERLGPDALRAALEHWIRWEGRPSSDASTRLQLAVEATIEREKGTSPET
jgi:hypothetical protein